MAYTIPNIPVLATQLNDTDLFEKADGPASGQSQRVTALVMKGYFGSAIQNQTVSLNDSTVVYSITHGLSYVPTIVRPVLVCIGSDSNTGYVAGREISTIGLMRLTSPFTTPTDSSDSVKIYWALPFLPAIGNESNYLLPRASDGAPIAPSSFSNFELKFYYA